MIDCSVFNLMTVTPEKCDGTVWMEKQGLDPGLVAG